MSMVAARNSSKTLSCKKLTLLDIQYLLVLYCKYDWLVDFLGCSTIVCSTTDLIQKLEGFACQSSRNSRSSAYCSISTSSCHQSRVIKKQKKGRKNDERKNELITRTIILCLKLIFCLFV